MLIEANKLDPEIELSLIENSHTYNPIPSSMNHWGFQLAEAFRRVGTVTFTDVLLLSWFNPGDTEKYILQVLHTLAEAEPNANFLIICGESTHHHSWQINCLIARFYSTFTTHSRR